MPQAAAFGTHENVHAEKFRRLPGKRDAAFVADLHENGMRIVVRDHFAGTAVDFDADFGGFGEDHVVDKLGAVAEGESDADAENAVRNAPEVGG